MANDTDRLSPLDPDVIEVARFLLENHVPSFGPETGQALTHISLDLNKKLMGDRSLGQRARRKLERYSSNLASVVITGAMHQGIVIGELERLVKKSSGIPPKNS